MESTVVSHWAMAGPKPFRAPQKYIILGLPEKKSPTKSRRESSVSNPSDRVGSATKNHDGLRMIDWKTDDLSSFFDRNKTLVFIVNLPLFQYHVSRLYQL